MASLTRPPLFVARSWRQLCVACLIGSCLFVIPAAGVSAQDRDDRPENRFRKRDRDRDDRKSAQAQPEQRGLIYDEENNRWIYEQPPEQAQPPIVGPQLYPPGSNPPRYTNPEDYRDSDHYRQPDRGSSRYSPQSPEPFDWGSGYSQQVQPGWQAPGLPSRFDPREHRELAFSLRSDLDYLQALSWRENLSREHRELVEIAAQNGERFSEMMINGAPDQQARQQYARFDEAWHPAAHMFAEGEFSNRVTGLVHEINRIDNRFHAELNYDQANVYDERLVDGLAGDLVQLTADLANDVRRGQIPAFGRDGRLLQQLSREASAFASRGRRDGDYDDVVKSFREFEAVWSEVRAEAFRVPDISFRSWRNGRLIYQTVHDLQRALYLAPEREQPNHYGRLVQELQGDAQTILQLVRQQGRRSEVYAAWAFYQDSRDLSLALSAGQGSFHRQAAQTLNSWRDIRGQLDGQQFVQPINRVEANLRILERLIN